LSESLGVGQAMRFAGELDQAQMADVYARSDILLLTSETEGVPRVVLEAMSCGLPVVVSDIPQLRELVAGCGIIYESRSEVEVASILLNLGEDTVRCRELGVCGRTRAVRSLTWKDTVDKTVALYRTVIRSDRLKTFGLAARLGTKVMQVHRTKSSPLQSQCG